LLLLISLDWIVPKISRSGGPAAQQTSSKICRHRPRRPATPQTRGVFGRLPRGKRSSMAPSTDRKPRRAIASGTDGRPWRAFCPHC